jgi:hypothetical protein
MFCDLFVNKLAFEDIRKAGQDLYRSVIVWKRGMTMAAFQSLDKKERLNRLVIGVSKISADNLRKIGSRLSSPADL